MDPAHRRRSLLRSLLSDSFGYPGLLWRGSFFFPAAFLRILCFCFSGKAPLRDFLPPLASFSACVCVVSEERTAFLHLVERLL